MAIKIPCSKIYGTPQHKLPKTFIDKVEYKDNDVKYSIDYNVNVYTIKSTSISTPLNNIVGKYNIVNVIDNKVSNDTDKFFGLYNYVYAFIELYYIVANIKIPKYSNNKLNQILEIYYGIADNERPNITVALQLKKTDYDINTELNIREGWETPITTSKIFKSTSDVYTKNSLDVNKEVEAKTRTDNPSNSGINNVETKVKAIVSDEISNQKSVEIKDYGNYYGLDLSFVAGNHTNTSWATRFWSNGNTAMGFYGEGLESYELPVQIEISFMGDIEKYEKVEIPLTYGNGKNVFATESNELLQSDTKLIKEETKVITIGVEMPSPDKDISLFEMYSNENFNVGQEFIYKNDVGRIRYRDEDDSYYEIEVATNGEIYKAQGSSISAIFNYVHNTNDYKSNSIIQAYKDGKETLELLCSIGEYYDEYTGVAISTKDSSKPMIFQIGNIVIPYKYTSEGEKPFSLKKDNTPKQFLVTSVTPFFDGAVWQRLTLQEI